MMGGWFYLGLQAGCMGPLLILMVESALHGVRTRQEGAALVGDVSALLEATMRIAAWGYAQTSFAYNVPALLLGAEALAFLSAASFGYAVARSDARDSGISWRVLALTLLPSWLAGLWAAVTREPGALTCGLTMSSVITHVVLLHSSAKLRRRAMLELDDRNATLLHEQMRPHFVFNSIAALRSLCETDPTLAASGLEDLAGYLRGNIEALADARIVPFERELEHVERYVALEQLNPASSFEVAYDLRVIDFELPVLSVEPLVENAIVHGVRSMGERGLVVVSTERYGDVVRVTVEDNGPGMPDGTTDMQSTRESRGVDNVRERLETLCGGSLSIQSDGEGTRAIMLVPQGKDSPWSR